MALEDVSFTYTDGERPALSRIRFAVAAGEMVGVMGASGAGKSTLAKCLNRIVPEFEGGAFAGVVRIGGRSLDGRARLRGRSAGRDGLSGFRGATFFHQRRA